MRTHGLVLLLFLVCGPSFAAKQIDTLPLVANLKPGAVFVWRQVDNLHWDHLTDNAVKCVVGCEPGNAGRLRLDLYEMSDDLPDWYFGSLIVGKSSTGIVFYGYQFGSCAEDIRDYAFVSNAGVAWPRYMTPDALYHTTSQLVNGSGVPWPNYGIDRALYALESPAMVGLYELSFESGDGASCGLVVAPGKGVVGVEMGWNFYVAQ